MWTVQCQLAFLLKSIPKHTRIPVAKEKKNVADESLFPVFCWHRPCYHDVGSSKIPNVAKDAFESCEKSKQETLQDIALTFADTHFYVWKHITESQNGSGCKGLLGITLSNPLATAVSPRSRCTGMRPGGINPFFVWQQGNNFWSDSENHQQL